MTTSEWITMKQAAEMLGVSRRTMYRYKDAGLVAWEKRFNKSVWVLASSVRKLMG